MTQRPTWGIVATIKAPVADILAFAAHHLDLGARRIYIYLDHPDSEIAARLSAHPKLRVRQCDDAYWRGSARPKMHQVRQTRNAGHAYVRADEVDWLAHIDVDEFLFSDRRIGDTLSSLSEDVHTARVRPMERLAGSEAFCKAFIPPGPDRARITQRIYPTYGRYLTGGFLSHVAGKVFARTGMPDVTFRIHNVFRGEDMNPGLADLPGAALCHVHARSWNHWRAAYRFRHDRGSYRAELGPPAPPGPPAPAGPAAAHQPHNLHALLAQIEAAQGEDGLRAFFDEVAADTPRLRAALEREGLLAECPLNLEPKIARHFPEI